MGIRDQENALFIKWWRRHQRFCPDGALDEFCYLDSSPMIVFLLKETNDFDEDLRDWLRRNDRSQTGLAPIS